MHGWVIRCAASLALGWGLACAQTAPPPATTGTNDIKTPFLDNYKPSEELQRRALGPLRIIKSLGDTGTAKKTVAPPVAPVAAPAIKPKVDDSANKTAKLAPAASESPVPEPKPVAAAVVTAPEVEPPVPVKEVNRELFILSQEPPLVRGALARELEVARRVLVKVAFDVNPDGQTAQIEITSSNNRKFNNAVRDAVAQWRFRPIDEGVRVETEVAFSSEE